jgi:DNA-binding NtrC family response regulator
MQAGAAAFLAKPLDPLKLVSTVRDLLGTSALVRSPRRAEVTS